MSAFNLSECPICSGGRIITKRKLFKLINGVAVHERVVSCTNCPYEQSLGFTNKELDSLDRKITKIGEQISICENSLNDAYLANDLKTKLTQLKIKRVTVDNELRKLVNANQ